MIKTIEKFGATWCGPCKMLDRNLAQLSDVEVIKHDADEESELFEKFGIRNVPTLYFKDEHGNVVEQTHGAISLPQIKEILAKYE